LTAAVTRVEPNRWYCWRDHAGTFHIDAERRTVEVAPDSDGDVLRIGQHLVALTGTIILYASGYPNLHASAVVIDGQAVAFLGAGGAGKSSMSAALARRGAAFLTDDVLRLDTCPDGTIVAHLGPPTMRLWQPSVQGVLSLDPSRLPKVDGVTDKRFLWAHAHVERAHSPAPLKRAYLLSRTNAEGLGDQQVTIHCLTGTEALTALLRQTATLMYLDPRDQAAMLPTFVKLSTQVSVRALSFPSGFEHQDAVCARILEDLSR